MEQHAQYHSDNGRSYDAHRVRPHAADAAAQHAAAAGAQACEVVQANMPLPPDVRETSGLARSTPNPDVFWTHNDAGNPPVLFALSADGHVTRRVQVSGAGTVTPHNRGGRDRNAGCSDVGRA